MQSDSLVQIFLNDVFKCFQGVSSSGQERKGEINYEHRDLEITGEGRIGA